MSIPKFEFSRHWTDPADFPTIETDETQVRADLQALHDETRDYFNSTLLPQIDSEIDEMKSWVTEAVKDAVLGELPEESVKAEKLADGAVGTAKLAERAVTREKIAADVTLPSPQALRVGEQRYDGSAEVELSSDGLKLDSASAQVLGLAENATMNEALAALAPVLSSARLASGSYVGNGKAGSGSPTTITFDFVPKLVFIALADNGMSFYESSGTGVIWFEGLGKSAYKVNNGSDYVLWTNFSVEGNTLKIWASETHTGDVTPTLTAVCQYNGSGTSYVYLAIGVKEGA